MIACYRFIKYRGKAKSHDYQLYLAINDIEDLDNWLEIYDNERTHQGRRCRGGKPMATLLDGKPIWKENS